MTGTEEIILSLVILGVLFALLGAGVWIGMTLLITGFVAVEFFTPAPSGSLLASTVWDASWPWTLTALPLFIWMGEILFRTKLSEDMFHGMSPWLNWLPGKLLHVNIVGCAIMSAITGSSAVCSATVGRMSVPELRRRGYDEFMAIGTLSGSGTLGMLIPPSIMMMVYGVVAQVSIGRLFIAGFLPGLMMMLMYQAYVVIWAKLYPEKQPRDDLALPFWEKVWATRRLIPAMILILLVLGSIYGGVATPTEAAVIGVLGSLAFSAASGTLTVENFKVGLINTVKTTSMIGLILAGGAFLSIALGFTGLPNVMAQWVDHLQLGKYELLIVLTILYIILGTALRRRLHDPSHRARRLPDDRQGRHRSAVVRHLHDDRDRDVADLAARRLLPLRGPEPHRLRPAHGLAGGVAVLHHADRRHRDPDHLPGDRHLAADADDRVPAERVRSTNPLP